MKKFLSTAILFVISMQAAYSDSDSGSNSKSIEDKEVRIYSSPEERREAGLGRKINDWLTISGLVELEKNYIENNFNNHIDDIDNARPQANLQLSFGVEMNDWLSAEFILDSEYDFDARNNENKYHLEWDEAFLEFSFEQWDLKIGRQYYPFGEYYSHFVTGPLIEFGETRSSGAVIDYTLNELFEWSVYLFESHSDSLSNKEIFDWGTNIEFSSTDESLRIGIGYLSDLSESDEKFSRENNYRYDNRVSAWNAYLLFGFESYEITAEFIKANGEFEELDKNQNKPFSYNVELAYFPLPQLQVAFRYEYTDEYSEEPMDQYGTSITWATNNNFTISADYLHGKFKNDFTFDDDDNELNNRDLFAIEMSLEF